MLFLSPVRRMTYYEGQNASGFLEEIQKYQEAGYYLAGWVAYEFGYMIEPALQSLFQQPGDRGILLADLGVYKRRYTFDHRTGLCDFPGLPQYPLKTDAYSISNVTLSQTKQEYIDAIGKVLDYIRAGDTYQVNYTLKLLFDFSGSPEGLYKVLRRNQSVSYGAYIRTGKRRVLSFSPELFFRKRDGKVVVRPMKGTMKRGRTLAEDAARQDELARDIKNRSENVMIVDLLRNDLGRLMHCTGTGSVGVSSLFDVEVYETLLQMTSTITAETTREALGSLSLSDIFKSLFPCGSVTGAPKIRTMQIIDELEQGRRGVYTGAIGYLAPNGDMMFNVPIRTVTLDGEKGEMGIGSGIVFDSDPEEEWQECLLKGSFLTGPAAEFQLIETLLYHPDDGYVFLNDHLKRLSSSASYFLFSCDLESIRAKLLEYARKLDGTCKRVRLTLEKDGTVSVSSKQCEQPRSLRLPKSPSHGIFPRVSLSKTRIDTGASWLFHKTTMRDVYDREFAQAREEGLFDVFFCNTKGEVTEGCITNVIVYKEGEFITPPVHCGLLPGVMRDKLLQDGERPLRVSVLTLDDVLQADALFFCNSVRGVVQVQLAEA